ncbi:MAG: hypothetical protein M9947_07240 [Thermomicrobiales bacterium]|nr:hypothetical protein [Thermomicrobiales bacterium]
MSDMDARALEGAARTAALRNANACQQMAELCGELLAVAPELTPREFLRTLGALVAGIDLGLMGFKQLARGGANGLVGAGFRAEYDDGTAGQARHFAGTAAAAALVGEKPAELLAHHVVDPAESIDGHLSTAALEFARLLVDGELSLAEAGDWIGAHICDPDFAAADGFTPFDVFSGRSVEISSLRARFSDAEWRELTELPERVAVAAALADPDGGFEDVRELVAGMRTIEAAASSESELVRALVAERYDEGFEWGWGELTHGARIERTLRAVHDELARLHEKDVPAGDIGAYARFLLTVANTTVRASRSGGLLGLGGREVSEREARFLDDLETVLEAGLPGCEGCLG